MPSKKLHRCGTALAAVACTGALLAGPSSASAFDCSASAVRGTVLS
ncbi:MAG: hypothetical protein JWM71_1889, partial [Solirubrobacteraceae bacterium]|nr:hypothetical protein [Solirubrobacteraceae bacterium]